MSPGRRNLLIGMGLIAALWGLWQHWSPPPENRADTLIERQRATRSAPSKTRRSPSVVTRSESVQQPEHPSRLDSTEPSTAPEGGWIRFHVIDEEGRPTEHWYARSRDCGLLWSSRLPESPPALPPGTCVFRGIRVDGLLETRTAPVEAEIVAGETTEIVLVFPPYKRGGLGISVAEHEAGLEILRVFPDTPADDLGLESGDLIVEVDGETAENVPLDTLIDEITGPEGTEVDIAIAWEGDTGWVYEELTALREPLEAESDGDQLDPRIGFMERGQKRIFGE